MRIRTSNLLIRSQVLYPVELWVHRRAKVVAVPPGTCQATSGLPIEEVSDGLGGGDPRRRRDPAGRLRPPDGPSPATAGRRGAVRAPDR